MEWLSRSQLPDIGHLAALALAALGIAASSISTALAVGAGEIPVTLLPW
jgi:hypothetical protein